MKIIQEIRKWFWLIFWAIVLVLGYIFFKEKKKDDGKKLIKEIKKGMAKKDDFVDRTRANNIQWVKSAISRYRKTH